jgi:hypothetical protein
MSKQKVIVTACSEASEAWHYLTRECDAFNKDSSLETAGHIGRTLLTFGISAALSIPETKRRIENHIIRLEKNLYEFQKRVTRCSNLAEDTDNIYEMLLHVEKSRFGNTNFLSCGFLDDSRDNEYLCNIKEVAFHIIEAKSFWGTATNSVQDISMRHKMVCNAKRLLEKAVKTPKLATMPHTPLSEKIKEFINAQIEFQANNLDEFVETATNSLKKALEEKPNLQKLINDKNVGKLKDIIKNKVNKDSFEKSQVIDTNDH